MGEEDSVLVEMQRYLVEINLDSLHPVTRDHAVIEWPTPGITQQQWQCSADKKDLMPVRAAMIGFVHRFLYTKLKSRGSTQSFILSTYGLDLWTLGWTRTQFGQSLLFWNFILSYRGPQTQKHLSYIISQKQNNACPLFSYTYQLSPPLYSAVLEGEIRVGWELLLPRRSRRQNTETGLIRANMWANLSTHSCF